MSEPTPEEVRAARRAELLALRAERQKAAAERMAAHELQVLELEEEYSQKLGPRGVAFDIVNEDNVAEAGPIVLKPATALRYKEWTSKSGTSVEDQFAYVKESVLFPSSAVFNDLASGPTARGELLARCTVVLNRLAGFSDLETKKK